MIALRKRRALVAAALTEKRQDVEDASNQFFAEREADHADALVSSLNGVDRLIEEAQLPIPWLAKFRRGYRRAWRHTLNYVRLHPAYASPHFRWDEFACNDGTPVPVEAREALQDWCRRIGEPLRERFGPLHIIAAYRTEVHAEWLGGARYGLHMYDLHPNAVAVDVVSATVSAAHLAAAAEDLADGIGRYTFFVHTDNRSRLGWPAASWWG